MCVMNCLRSGFRSVCLRTESYLAAEEWLRKTVTAHYVNKMIQCVVENPV